MHIPPYHKKESWQRFFVGALIGAVIAYCIVMYMYGSMYEKLFAEILDLQDKVTELKNHNDALLKAKEDLDTPITVEKIEVDIVNDKELQLDNDTLMKQQLEGLIKKEIDHIVGQDVTIVSESDKLLESTIENKEISIDEFTYSFTVTKLAIITKTVIIEVKGEVSN
ncbi:sporulation membrane protein YtrI [Virgibacillus oceani]|uniref:Sporulation membrane protein YtrI n=1 Tax=Virgibacillus oceani TaxID=1479511 RepID=A0A917GYT2_9BACI|nr:sporulation membrane protein YtrI [Virgibacillus oceani]GGG61764.1 sporulation membrane protein YtrI [Virgibacillus oceani]